MSAEQAYFQEQVYFQEQAQDRQMPPAPVKPRLQTRPRQYRMVPFDLNRLVFVGELPERRQAPGV